MRSPREDAPRGGSLRADSRRRPVASRRRKSSTAGLRSQKRDNPSPGPEALPRRGAISSRAPSSRARARRGLRTGAAAELVERGFLAAGTEPGMAADLDSLATSDLAPSGLRIERATTPEQVRQFAETLAALGTPPTRRSSAQLRRLLLLCAG